MSANWLHEKAGVVAVVNPANLNNSTNDSAAIDMSKFHEVLAVLLLGSVDNTFDMKFRESDTSGGTYSDISGKAITQLTSTDDNKQALLSLRADEITTGKQFVKLRVTVGNGTTNLGAAVVLGVPRIAPATDDDLSSVAQVVS